MSLEINTYQHSISPTTKKLDDFIIDETSFSSPTTSASSCRSSLSSITSFSSRRRRQMQCKSLPPPTTSPGHLYPTLKSAHERIEWLEEQIKAKKQANESDISDTFFRNQNNNDDLELQEEVLLNSNTKDNQGNFIKDKLNELKQLVNEYNITLSLDDTDDNFNLKNEIFFSTQIIENWILLCTTQHNKSTKQDLQNVKHQRLVQAMTRLGQQHTQIKKQLKCSEASKDTLKMENAEMEQLLDQVRKEMEDMMEELNSVKLQRQRYFEKSKRYETDLNSNSDDALLRESETTLHQLESDFEQQIQVMTHAHAKEKKQLKTKLVAAKRSVAELSLLMEVRKKQYEQPSEMEQVLRRTIAERDGEIAQIKSKLDKTQRHTEQWKQQQDRQLQLELNTRLEALKQSLQDQYKKTSDTYQVQISRDLRSLSGQMMELETELQGLERQHKQDTRQRQEAEKQIKRLQVNGERSTGLVDQLHDKIEVLNKEVLTLYKKNLELAQQLGELVDF